MAENKLEQLISQAQNSLVTAFGKDFNLEDESATFLNLEELKKAYSKEITREIVAKDFTQLAKSIRKMRSSYLPVDFFQSIDTSLFSADLVNSVSQFESYENAFMRMLGMPLVGDNSLSSSEITSAENIKRMNKDTGVLEEVAFEIVQQEVLDERQKNRDERRIQINNSIYNLTEESVSNVVEENPGLIGLDVQPPEEDQSSDPRIIAIENDLFKFSYLLIPPIQDGRIAGCINEPEKIVAPPFSNTRARQINGVKIRPTLLESILRIRLDKVSGTDSFTQTEESLIDFGSLSIGTSEQVIVDANSFGVLESLFILRLRSALGGLAKKLIKDIDDLAHEIEKSQHKPDPDASPVVASPEASTQLVEQDDGSAVSDPEQPRSINQDKIDLLTQQKLIEDSILTLLGDNSEVLSLQSQTQRNSSLHDAHLISGIVDIINVPRKRIEADLNEIEVARKKVGGEAIDGLAANVNTALGADIGIGTIDIIVFALALFTIEEKFLLGLLTTEQFDLIKTGEFKALLPETGEKEDTLVSVNALSDLLSDGYQIFLNELKNDQP